MFLLELRHPFRRGDQVEALYAPVAELLELGHRVAGAAAGGEHRVDHDRQLLALRRRHLGVVGDRLGRILVALHTEDADLGVGQHAEHRVEHAHAGAEDRHQHDVLVDERAAGLRHRGDDVDGLHPHVLERLECEKLGDLVHQLAEELRRGRLVAHQGHAVVHERVLKNGMHLGSLLGLRYYTINRVYA